MSPALSLASRRDLLKRAAMLAVPASVPSTALAATGRTSANAKLRVGLIGAGNRAKWLARSIAREGKRAELVAVCDCYLPQVDVLAADYEQSAKVKPKWAVYQNYKELYDNENLDAVIIATPDHARVHAAILACKKGLDIYAEKPLHFSIPEGRALVQAVRKHKRILQVGTQQRSTANNIYSCKFVRDGGLGQVKTVHVMNYSGSQSSTGLKAKPVPKDMDWNRFCAQAPLLDYNEDLHRNWRRYDAFTSGPIGDRGSHALDMVHLAMGWDKVAPTRIVPTTRADKHQERGVRLEYPSGTVVQLENIKSPAFGGIFIGERGKIEIDRGRFTCDPANLLTPFNGADTENHVANWLDCIQSRKEPNAPVEVGHLISSIAHLINICRTVDRPIDWDADKEQIKKDDKANDLLVKVRRKGFELPAI